MITSEQIGAMSGDEHRAWLDSLQGDEKEIVYCPEGHRSTLVLVSVVKRFLAAELETSWRLQFLEWLEKIGNNWITAPSVAVIEPMCDGGYEMVCEAQKLGAKKSLDVYGRYEVFSAFVALNPSILTAIKMPRAYHYRRSD
jgi:hypothetical protein